jgi:hypothetical protein
LPKGKCDRRFESRRKKRIMRIVLSILPLAVLFCGQGCIATSTHHANTAADFGPARERVLPFGAPCVMHLFQFRSGEVFVDGHGPGTTQEQALQDQRRIDDAGGFDLYAHGDKTGFQLVGEGCLFARVPHGLGWDKTTAKQVMAEMKHVNFVRPPRAGTRSDPFAASTGGGFGVTLLEAQDLPITHLFKTVRSEVGIMEILDIVEDDRGYAGDGKGYGMKLRYKMVHQ